MTIIKKIPTESTFMVRNVVLRPNLPIETCHFDGDNLSSTTHFGYYHEEKLVGVLSLFDKTHLNWNDKQQLQIRGMAILEDFQKKGIGQMLVHEAISFAKKNNNSLVWCNARKNAVPFYEKINFHIHGTAFEIEGVGTHFLMYHFI